jgi:ketosteroid isomerase-like protein
MSQEDVQNLRAFLETWTLEAWTLEAWRRGKVDMSLLDPDVNYEDTTLPGHTGETYHGRKGVIRATERWIEQYEWLLIEVEQIVDAGDRLVSVQRVRAKARRTGTEFDELLAYLWTFRDGKIVHFRSFRDPEQAMEAAGLRE